MSPVHKPAGLVARYRRVRAARRFTGDADRIRQVFVLSRVTLGADVAVTSVMLDAAKRRFPKAEICFLGAEKNWQLFAADPRLRWLPVSYGRSGTLRDRLAVWPELTALLSQPAAVVIDPDSRLTQLGLLPVCPEESYYLFESRAYGGDGLDSLTTLAQRWAAAVFDVPDAAPYVAPAESPDVARWAFHHRELGGGRESGQARAGPVRRRSAAGACCSRQAPVVVDLGAGDEEEAARAHGHLTLRRARVPGAPLARFLRRPGRHDRRQPSLRGLRFGRPARRRRLRHAAGDGLRRVRLSPHVCALVSHRSRPEGSGPGGTRRSARGARANARRRQPPCSGF